MNHKILESTVHPSESEVRERDLARLVELLGRLLAADWHRRQHGVSRGTVTRKSLKPLPEEGEL